MVYIDPDIITPEILSGHYPVIFIVTQCKCNLCFIVPPVYINLVVGDPAILEYKILPVKTSYPLRVILPYSIHLFPSHFNRLPHRFTKPQCGTEELSIEIIVRNFGCIAATWLRRVPECIPSQFRILGAIHHIERTCWTLSAVISRIGYTCLARLPSFCSNDNNSICRSRSINSGS